MSTADASPPIRRIGLIAGGGSFPFEVARAAKQKGVEVICAGIRNEVSSELQGEVDVFRRLGLLSFGRYIRYFRRHGVRHLSFAGWVRKERLFSWRGVIAHFPDFHCLRFAVTKLRRMDWRSQTLLRALADEFEEAGFELAHSSHFCPELLVKPGVLTSRQPTDKQNVDIGYGWTIAKRMAELDVGQSVCVIDRSPIAVEGMEGTDRCIRRAGELCKKPFVVVKLAMEGHDMRFDVPTIGPQTIEVLAEAGAAVLAVEAHKTIVLEHEKVVALANKRGIVIVALEGPPEP